jgi:hypothetical protein
MTNSEAVNFAVWAKAPKERTAAYFPTYALICRAMQAALRKWVREWFHAHPEVLSRTHTAFQILVYFSTHPFRGKRTNTFTYDIQQTDMINLALASAASNLSRELSALDTSQLPRAIREQYFAYRHKRIIQYVSRNRRILYRMLNADTVLMDAVLNFAVTGIPTLGVEEASLNLRDKFSVQLNRMSDEIDLGGRTDQLLRIITDQLTKVLET